MAQATRPPRPAQRSLVKGARAARTTVALKLAMAGSGILFIAFVLAHMYGNLKAFAGEESFNSYAEHLREIGEPILPHSGALWIIRIALLAALVVHVVTALLLWRRAKSARSTAYVVTKNKNSTFSSHWMRWGGITLLVFIVWHLLNFTIGKVNPQGGATDNPYTLLVDTFDVWWMTIIYLVAMAALAMHLRHGTWSAAQTLGLTNTARQRRSWNALGYTLAVVIAGGYSVVPIAVLLGIIEK